MNRAIVSALATAGALALCGGANAQDAWRAVSLDGGVRIDVPVVVGEQYRSTAGQLAAGELMGFVVSADDSGTLSCLLNRFAYHQPPIAPLGVAEMTTIVTSDRRSGLCAGGTTMEVMLSKSATTREGYPAADCVAVKTDPSDAKTPGHVEVVEGIAAPGAFYNLSCTVSAATQTAAFKESARTIEGDEINHVEASLRLP